MEKQRKELYFHLGLPKTGSSYLQHTVFPKLKGIRFYPKPYFDRFPELVEKDDHQRYLFSLEAFANLYDRAKKIADHYPEAHIILVLRRHDRWISSKYKYYIWKSGTMGFREYFDIHEDRGYWKRSDLEFGTMIDTISAYFERSPLLLFLEDLKADPFRWNKRLQQFTGTYLPPDKLPKKAVKVSFEERQLILLRAFNRRFPYHKPQNWPKPFKKLHVHIRQGVNHLVAWSALLLPSSYFKGKELIPQEDLEAIRTYYAEDWTYCRNRVTEEV